MQKKSKTVLYGYRWFHCIHKKRNYRKYGYTKNVETMKSKRKNKMKDELVGKIMKKLVGLKEKTYSYI